MRSSIGMLSYLMSPDIITELSNHRDSAKMVTLLDENAQYDSEVSTVL